MKYSIKSCTGFFLDDVHHCLDVLISTDSWDGVEDEDDESIFFYTDGEPITKGLVVAENFFITDVREA